MQFYSVKCHSCKSNAPPPLYPKLAFKVLFCLKNGLSATRKKLHAIKKRETERAQDFIEILHGPLSAGPPLIRIKS